MTMTPPAIYQEDGETFHPFDFVVYEAVLCLFFAQLSRQTVFQGEFF